ncbi:MAG TPA: carbamoyltransferase C-terminal domain-containing protein [Syntrophales bacterium]|nr:carbamoyltransferase C-terminal domain-containing protein [Syntrophales bacterium]
MQKRTVLGIWDGHDAGAALVTGDRLLFAINEERLTRRKLEVGFPACAIQACLDFAGLNPARVDLVAASTTDPAKTLTRLVPRLKEEYYLIRRRKLAPRGADPFKKAFKYRFTELAPNAASRALSRAWLKRRLGPLGLGAAPVAWVDHHFAHAAAAACCSGFAEALVVTLDGVGDGRCGSLWRFADGRLALIRALPARASFGIFFEHVTNLMNMRELEDEGKVMALANYAYPIPDEENPLFAVIGADGLDVVSPHTSTAMFRELKKILWRYPSEQFAYMAQRVLERGAAALVAEALRRTGLKKIAAAGGVFSNIKLNMRLAGLPGVENVYIFPHMGDGGLAIGAAMAANLERNGVSAYALPHLYLGPDFSPADIAAALDSRLRRKDKGGQGNDRREASPEGMQPGGGVSPLSGGQEAAAVSWVLADGLRWRRSADAPAEAARLILSGEIVLWFRGRMEIGPRALGNRGILARPDSRDIKDRLNVVLKKRVWYQPFCPSMLAEDAPALIEATPAAIADNPFMTMAFRVRPERLPLMAGVINIDGTCRPQFVGDENPAYRDLLRHVRAALGYGVILNTSFNIHGEPLVCSPDEAVRMLVDSGIRYLFLDDWLMENLHAKMD